MTTREIAKIGKALGDENRVMILELLTAGEKCACRLLDALGVTQPTLSHHMKILCESGLVSGRKDGKWMYYSLKKEKILETKKFLEELSGRTKEEISVGN